MDDAQIQRLKELRRRGRTDLFWLSTKVLGYDFVERVHGPVCDLFVHKDPKKPFAQQDTIKQRLLLDPRGHFKTTVDVCDTVQWILNFPDVRILIMTGTLELAERMLYEVQHHFTSNPQMRLLYPEFCAPPGQKIGNTSEMTTPARKLQHLREPTVTISTIDSVKAGSHYDIIKCDDLVHENNIGTKEQIEKTIQAFHYTTPLLEPYGYRDVIGTRYDYSDLYGSILDGLDMSKATPIPFGFRLEDGDWKVQVRQVWIERKDDASGASVSREDDGRVAQRAAA